MSGSSRLYGANLGSNTTYYYYLQVSVTCYEGMVGLVGHGGVEDNWLTGADIIKTKSI